MKAKHLANFGNVCQYLVYLLTLYHLVSKEAGWADGTHQKVSLFMQSCFPARFVKHVWRAIEFSVN